MEPQLTSPVFASVDSGEAVCVALPLHFPANLINWLLLHLAVFTPFIREGIEKEKARERKFYAEAEALRNR